MTKNIITGAVIIGAALGVLAFFGLTPFGQQIVQQFGSPAGTTFNTAKVAQEVINTSTTTQLSILNTDASSRIITSADIAIYGGAATGSVPTLTCATSSTATLGGQPAANKILAANLFALGTTTSNNMIYVSSSSPGITGTTTASFLTTGTNVWARTWNSGSYMTCSLTASDNSANLMDSGMVGTVGFKYLAQ